MEMKMDSQAAIRQMENEESSARAKYIDIKLIFFRATPRKEKRPVCVNLDDGG